MGNKICVCDGDSHNEKESNIFSFMAQKNSFKKEELRTLTIDNKNTLGSAYRTFFEDSTSINNNKEENILNEISKSKNNSQKIEEIKIHESNKEDNNFHCSGKFNFPENYSNYRISNGKNNNEHDSINIKENKEINNNGSGKLKKNELGFVSFKSLIVDNNHIIQLKDNKDNKDNIDNKDNKENKDNNMTISNNFDQKKEKENILDIKNNSELINNIQNNKKIENGNPYERNQNYGLLRYYEISKYSDVGDEDFLNYESNYTNSNQREENRNEQSLFDEDGYENNN